MLSSKTEWLRTDDRSALDQRIEWIEVIVEQLSGVF